MTQGNVSKSSGRESRSRIKTVKIRNYKSIGKCCLELKDLTILVGRNGAGKSNFLDALRFVAESLQTSLDHAVKSRGGIDEVRRRSTGHPRNFSFGVDVALPDYRHAAYHFEITARGRGVYMVKKERLNITRSWDQAAAFYDVAEGAVRGASRDPMPPAAADRLYLVTAASLPEFRDVYDALRFMGFYNLNPREMKELQSPDAGELLHYEGGNIASVIARLGADAPDAFERIKAYLAMIVPGTRDIVRVALGPRETLEFRQEVKGAQHPWKFLAASMSDGTLRALGALSAVTQFADPRSPVTLVGIEEPETALHPAAAGALMDALREAAQFTRVVVTTHSPDLLDQYNPESDGLHVVELVQGVTRIARPDGASTDAIRRHLYSAGELLRLDQIETDPSHIEEQERLKLFDDDPEGQAE